MLCGFKAILSYTITKFSHKGPEQLLKQNTMYHFQVCLVEGGNPKPDVFWFRDGSLWDQELDPSTYEDVLQNTLVISELGRSFQVLNCDRIFKILSKNKETIIILKQVKYD